VSQTDSGPHCKISYCPAKITVSSACCFFLFKKTRLTSSICVNRGYIAGQRSAGFTCTKCTLCKPCHMKFIWPSSIVCSIPSNPIQSSETCALRVPLLLNCQTMTALTGHYTNDNYYYGDCIIGNSTAYMTVHSSIKHISNYLQWQLYGALMSTTNGRLASTVMALYFSALADWWT
jgi:hypothetical protein